MQVASIASDTRPSFLGFQRPCDPGRYSARRAMHCRCQGYLVLSRQIPGMMTLRIEDLARYSDNGPIDCTMPPLYRRDHVICEANGASERPAASAN